VSVLFEDKVDSVLIDYLKSGKAWVFIGSGPSNEMGYPSWGTLASVTESEARMVGRGSDFTALDSAVKRKDYPGVFQAVEGILGEPSLRQILQEQLKPTGSGEIYELMARWPVPIYLTTNYDDEIQRKLAELREAYVSYSNSEDHLASLSMDQEGAIFKLHGDLRSENGLILTKNQYRAIEEGDEWAYWRTKMTSVFQMARVVVVGHSLSDKNIRHVLGAAKRGAGVVQPVCWIAPDVDLDQSREFLEMYRIRVISYDNRDGTHRNLRRLLKHITQFIPPRTAIGIREQIARVSQSPLGSSAAAPGFFVFNKLAAQSNYDEKRIEIILASIQAALPALSSRNFTVQEALSTAGWPTDFPIPLSLAETIESHAIDAGIIERENDQFKTGRTADAAALENKTRFTHSRERFEASLKLRLKKSFPGLADLEVNEITKDIEASLTGYFREGGLSLATILFSADQRRERAIPSSIIRFISEASAKYDDLLRRQAFVTVSTDIFTAPEAAEREYLGRISQGFFAFHSLGVFGDVAIKRYQQAKETVWLFDSNTHIPALALAAPTNPVFADCFTRLKSSGVRMFTTGKLFDETYSHLRFADNIMKDFGSASAAVIAAATGQPPYRRTNQFLEGFIRWQAAGNPADWEAYLYEIFGERHISRESLRIALEDLGLEVVRLQDWPGFSDFDYESIEQYTQEIVDRLEQKARRPTRIDSEDDDFALEALRKAKPEAEALVIIQEERDGNYYILSDEGVNSPAWFISNTSMLNILIDAGQPITWRPEEFLSFTTTLVQPSDSKSTERAFEAILWGCAQSGLSLIDDRIIADVFGGAIDQATLSLSEQEELYESTIGEKYGEPVKSVMARINPANKLLATIQLTNEISIVVEERLKQAQAIADAATRRANIAEKNLAEVEKYRGEMEARKKRGQRIARKQKNKPTKRRK
jgi:hypothetical protein